MELYFFYKLCRISADSTRLLDHPVYSTRTYPVCGCTGGGAGKAGVVEAYI